MRVKSIRSGHLNIAVIVTIFTLLFGLMPRAGFAAIVQLTEPVKINGITLTSLDSGKSLLEQYKAASQSQRSLNQSGFKVTITRENETKVITSWNALQNLILGNDQGVGFFTNPTSTNVQINNAARWVIRDQFISSQIQKYENLRDSMMDDLLEDYAESLQAERIQVEIEMQMIPSAMQMLRATQQAITDIYSSAATDQFLGLLLALLGCSDSGGTGCLFDNDCDGYTKTQDVNDNDPNVQTVDDLQGGGDSGDGIIWGKEPFASAKINILNILQIYNTYLNRDLIFNVVSLKSNLILSTVK